MSSLTFQHTCDVCTLLILCGVKSLSLCQSNAFPYGTNSIQSRSHPPSFLYGNINYPLCLTLQQHFCVDKTLIIVENRIFYWNMSTKEQVIIYTVYGLLWLRLYLCDNLRVYQKSGKHFTRHLYSANHIQEVNFCKFIC